MSAIRIGVRVDAALARGVSFAFEYQRASVTLGTSLPTVAGITGALEMSAGTSWNGPPVQRRFYLGGGNTLRGFQESELAGEAFWYGRAELATGSPAFRLAVFGDAAWAGPKGGFGFDDPWASVGLGASLMDGVVRLDFARGARRGDRWRLYLYLDGVLRARWCAEPDRQSATGPSHVGRSIVLPTGHALSEPRRPGTKSNPPD